jgi:peptidyl-prolyl cis-trans isomerase B (cyclophilin B)
MRKSVFFVFVIFACLASAALGQQSTPTPEAKANARPAAPTDSKPEPFDKADVAKMAGQCVTLDSESGVIEIELYPEHAPESVRNFLNLSTTGLLDGTTFDRVVPGFVIQGGNMWSREGGKVSRAVGERARRTIPDEPNKVLHERGVVSMARSDEPNTATTNFFILVKDASFLDGKFAAFGRVTKGLDIVDAINKAPVSEEKPDKPVRIKKATVSPCVNANPQPTIS